jgi:hypothetical protein
MSDGRLRVWDMDGGPILRRELLVAARRGMIGLRAGSAAMVVVVIAAATVGWDVEGKERTSPAGMSAFAHHAFGWVVAMQGVLTLLIVPEEVVRLVAGGRQRKTWDALLASGLSSTEIVLGVLTGALVRWAACVAAGMPVVVLMVPLMGIDPRLLLVAQAGLAATAFVLGGLAVAISASARDRRVALMRTIGLAVAWLELPILAVLLLPPFWPAAARWLEAPARWLVESSPAGVLAAWLGVFTGRRPVTAAWRMIACETAGGLALVAWAILRLRHASRALADAESRSALARRRARGRRPTCGANPLLWKELHATRCRRDLLGFAVLLLAGFSVLGLYFAKAAFVEVATYGYGPSPRSAGEPTTMFQWAVVMGRGIPPPPGQARAVFNQALRGVTLVFSIFIGLLVTEHAARSVADERERDTWPGLCLTPLSGHAIFQAKALGALWKVRALLVLLSGLWLVGVLAGAVHPLGFLSALALLLTSTALLAMMGAATSLWSSDRERATERNMLFTIVATFSGVLPRLLPRGIASVVLGAGSGPLLLWLALLSYGDVDAALRRGTFPQLALLAMETGEGAGAVLATCLAGLAGQIVVAGFLLRAAARSYDAAGGPPCPPPEPRCHAPPTQVAG